MTTQDNESAKDASARLAAAVGQAEQAINSAKQYLAGTDFDALRAKASDTATNLYREGRDFLHNSEDLAKAKEGLAESVRKNPLAAVGIAFTAGLVLALLTRG